jgi:hypothetical protein
MQNISDQAADCSTGTANQHQNFPPTLGFSQSAFDLAKASLNLFHILNQLIHIRLQMLNLGAVSCEFTLCGEGLSHVSTSMHEETY